VLALEAVEPFAGELSALDGERAYQLVVPLRDIAGAGGLRDLGIVQLGSDAIDVRDLAAVASERLDDEVLEDSLLGRARRGEG
jgi:hypothetical protein